MPWVVAVSEPTSTVAVGEKYTPLGLLKITCPLALMRPKIWLGELPVMRLSSTLLDDGWAMLTWACEPTSKLFQLITARALSWVMDMVAPDWLTRA